MKIQQKLNKGLRKEQSGRSMVEMLGVLAIISVLSVGGVAGYRYAMVKIFENDVRHLFARIYQAIQSASLNPNTYLNCCSGNTTKETTYNRCKTNDKWFTEQYEELCSYLSPNDCKTSWEYSGIQLMGTKSLGHWQYLSLVENSMRKAFMITFYWPIQMVKKYDNNLSSVCENILTDIVSNPVYQENLLGITRYRFVDFVVRQATSANIKTVCQPYGSQGYIGFSIYFKNNNLVDCVADDERE